MFLRLTGHLGNLFLGVALTGCVSGGTVDAVSEKIRIAPPSRSIAWPPADMAPNTVMVPSVTQIHPPPVPPCKPRGPVPLSDFSVRRAFENVRLNSDLLVTVGVVVTEAGNAEVRSIRGTDNPQIIEAIVAEFARSNWSPARDDQCKVAVSEEIPKLVEIARRR